MVTSCHMHMCKYDILSLRSHMQGLYCLLSLSMQKCYANITVIYIVKLI